jgi:hypothetical protein
LIEIIGCLVFFFTPVLIYALNTKEHNVIFWSLLGYAVFFFPMGLLAVIMFDSIRGLNPVLLIGSIFSTFFQYCGLVLSFCAVGGLFVIITSALSRARMLAFVLKVVSIYLTMVVVHLLGRFYWRYREKLNWDV